MIKGLTLAALLLLVVHANAWAQTVSGVRGINGGVGALHGLTGPTGSLYIDGQATQGSLYAAGTFQSYSFRSPNGPGWIGSIMTLGPRLTVGLIAGANQSFFSLSTGTTQLVSSPTVIPPPPRELPPLPEIDSSLLDIP